jgi:hypothetical protein
MFGAHGSGGTSRDAHQEAVAYGDRQIIDHAAQSSNEKDRVRKCHDCDHVSSIDHVAASGCKAVTLLRVPRRERILHVRRETTRPLSVPAAVHQGLPPQAFGGAIS